MQRNSSLRRRSVLTFDVFDFIQMSFLCEPSERRLISPTLVKVEIFTSSGVASENS